MRLHDALNIYIILTHIILYTYGTRWSSWLQAIPYHSPFTHRDDSGSHFLTCVTQLTCDPRLTTTHYHFLQNIPITPPLRPIHFVPATGVCDWLVVCAGRGAGAHARAAGTRQTARLGAQTHTATAALVPAGRHPGVTVST